MAHKLAPLCHPIRSKYKTQGDSPVRIFPRFSSATRICFEFWLAYCTVNLWLTRVTTLVSFFEAQLLSTLQIILILLPSPKWFESESVFPYERCTTTFLQVTSNIWDSVSVNFWWSTTEYYSTVITNLVNNCLSYVLYYFQHSARIVG